MKWLFGHEQDGILSNGPAARLLRRSLFVLILVTYGPVVTCYVYSCPNICIIPYLSRFPEVTIPNNSLCLESYFYREDTFSGKSYFSEVAFPRSHISQEVLFPREVTFCHTLRNNSLCLGSYSYEKILFPGSHISQEVAFPGRHIFQKVTFPEKLSFPENHI